MEYEFNITYYIDIYKKWWKIIIPIVLITMVLTACFALTTPVIYSSTATIFLGGSGASSGSIGKLLGIPSLSTGGASDAIVPLLQSRRMAKDINEHFDLAKKPKFRYSINTGGETVLAVQVRGTDPELTGKIANWAIENLDKINMELNITSNKPMAKVLDPATYGSPLPRQVLKKAMVSGMLIFLLISAYVFFSEYLKKQKLK